MLQKRSLAALLLDWQLWPVLLSPELHQGCECWVKKSDAPEGYLSRSVSALKTHVEILSFFFIFYMPTFSASSQWQINQTVVSELVWVFAI
jgi:hypothetical protein